MCGAESPGNEETLFAMWCVAPGPTETITRDRVRRGRSTLLHNGIESTRGRYGAYLLRDRVQGHELHGRAAVPA